jgi:hypothetical protein
MLNSTSRSYPARGLHLYLTHPVEPDVVLTPQLGRGPVLERLHLVGPAQIRGRYVVPGVYRPRRVRVYHRPYQEHCRRDVEHQNVLPRRDTRPGQKEPRLRDPHGERGDAYEENGVNPALEIGAREEHDAERDHREESVTVNGGRPPPRLFPRPRQGYGRVYQSDDNHYEGCDREPGYNDFHVRVCSGPSMPPARTVHLTRARPSASTNLPSRRINSAQCAQNLRSIRFFRTSSAHIGNEAKIPTPSTSSVSTG